MELVPEVTEEEIGIAKPDDHNPLSFTPDFSPVPERCFVLGNRFNGLLRSGWSQAFKNVINAANKPLKRFQENKGLSTRAEAR
ncbi:MAG TPA: hypothetical protein VGQ39_08365 [Pyrinomonadaceae bacterium]|jgi:hypothetical protein|nr:hypothetical protein [Pyrinomonadaceae bacterium]